MRFAQIVAIILSTFVLAFPSFTLITIALLLAVVLFVVGIERIITGLFLQGKPRWTNIGLGVLVIVLSGISMEFASRYHAITQYPLFFLTSIHIWQY